MKVLVFGLASLGLWAAGHHRLAVALLVFSVVVNALAQLPDPHSRERCARRTGCSRSASATRPPVARLSATNDAANTFRIRVTSRGRVSTRSRRAPAATA